jgi:hypothetical protein
VELEIVKDGKVILLISQPQKAEKTDQAESTTY